jgi:hypothetical protein
MTEKKRAWLIELGTERERREWAAATAKEMAIAYLSSARQSPSTGTLDEAIIAIYDAVAELFGLE